MSNSDTVRYNINADKAFDRELRELVRNGNISGFFLDAARTELKRIRREKAMQAVNEMADPFAAIEDPAPYIHDLRRKDTEHRTRKLDA
jgi:hypothetical protein